MKKKLLITGASGFLGYHLMRLAGNEWEVYGISHTNDFDFKNAVAVKCDITNYIELGNYFDDIEPDAVIHAAAISDANYCQQHRDESYVLNVEATKNLAGICSDYHIPFAFTSSDLVFDGTEGMYREEDAKNPVSAYGEQKSIGEEEVLRIYSLATVFRLPLMFGYPSASTGNYIQKFLSQIKSGEPVPLFNDEYRSMCGAKSISEGILQLFENNSGIIHLAGRERLSRYDFGRKAMQAFQLASDKVKSCSQKDVKMSAPRPADVSLNISKAVHLGYSPLSVDEELNQIADNHYL